MKSNFLFIFFILFVKNLFSIPYQLDHLSNQDQNVFLIYDYHDEVSGYLGIDFNKDSSKYVITHSNLSGFGISYDFNKDQAILSKLLLHKKGSMLNGKYLVLESEKTLIEKLIEINNNSKEINLIWEACDDLLLKDLSSASCFMGWAPYYLKNNLKINLIPSDNLRHMNIPNLKSNFAAKADWFLRYIESPWMKLDKSDIIYVYKELIIFLEKLIFELIPRKVNHLSEADKNYLIKDLHDFYLVYIKPYKNLNDNDLYNIIMKKFSKDKKFKKDFDKLIVVGIADIEILASILNSKNCIVYAGGAHCDSIKTFLIEKKQFKLINRAGTDYFDKKNIAQKSFLIMKLISKFCYNKFMYWKTNNLLYLTEQHTSKIKLYKPLDPQTYEIFNSMLK